MYSVSTMDAGLRKGNVKTDGWCNACTERPPYTPDMVYVLKVRNTHINFCPKCATLIRYMFTSLVPEKSE